MLKFISFVVMVFLCIGTIFLFKKILNRYDEVVGVIAGLIVSAIIFALYNSFLIPLM